MIIIISNNVIEKLYFVVVLSTKLWVVVRYTDIIINYNKN